MAVIKIVPMPGAVGDKGDEGAVGPQGPQGAQGLQGVPGADALWSYNGQWQSNASYAEGDVVTYQGQLYYTKSVTTAGTLPTNTTKFDLIASKGADGQPGTNGTNGTNGANGADALWNYTGEYSSGASYAVGDIATYDGQLWYRYNANGGNVGDTPSPGLWNLLAAKGADGSGGTANTGDITFDGVKIIGTGTASGDGSNRGTIDLVPDADLLTNQYHEDQYLIVDPTAPNHIHIRAGGTQDASAADLFLGGERNNVRVSDGGRSVSVSTRPNTVINTYTNQNTTSNTSFVTSNASSIYIGDTLFYVGGDIVTVDSITQDSPSAGLQTITANLNGAPASFVAGEPHIFSHEEEWNNYWQFTPDGTLSGPSMGGLKVLGLLNSGDNDLGLYANDADIYLQASSGAVTIAAPEVTITSNAVPSSVNINTYSGAKINSARTSGYSDADKVVATLGDLPTGATGTFETPDSKLVTVTNGIITSIESLT
jgi:hypothetical protein